jgi:hypothetical protein
MSAAACTYQHIPEVGVCLKCGWCATETLIGAELARLRSALTAAEARATRAEGARATAERERDAIRRVLGESLRQMLDRVHAAEAAIRNSGVDYHLRTVRLGLIAAAEAVDADALAGEAQKATAP